jgi:hypothetical protein
MDQTKPIGKVLSRLEKYSERSGEYRAKCPAHNGNSVNSLSITQGENGRALLHCHAGCGVPEIAETLGLSVTDLFEHKGQSEPVPTSRSVGKKKPKESKKKRTLTSEELPDGNVYGFTSPSGEVLYAQAHKGSYYKKIGEDLWQEGLNGFPQVLYNLHELVEGVRAGKVIFHTEGPKDTETAKEKLDVVATTSGGTTSWRKEFRSYYVGADVVIVGDNDAKGRKYVAEVAEDLHPVARRVKVVELPGLGEAEDLTDWLEAGHTAEEFFEVVEKTGPYNPEEEEPWPEPRGLNESLPPVKPLDERMVPEPLREWVLDTSKRMDNAPPDFAAVAAVVIAGSLLGRKVGVRPKRNDDWTAIPNLWGGLVGLPSTMKSPTLSQALRPVKRLSALRREEYEKVLKAHELDMMVTAAEKVALKKDLEATARKVTSASASRDDLEKVRTQLEELEEPTPPTPRRYTTNDTSIEKMAELLIDNPDGLLLYRDELTGGLRSLDKAGHEAARAFYLEAWNGDGSHEVDRIGRGSLFVKAVCVSVLGGIQPGPLRAYVEGAFDDGEGADGLLQRLQVLVYPDGSFSPTDLTPNTKARDRAYKIFEGLAELDVGKFVGGLPEEQSGDEVPYLNFESEAQDVFDEWRKTFEQDVVSEGHPAALESHFMKYRSLFASLALVFEAIDFIDGVEGAGLAINKANAMRAYVWCEYLKGHAIRIYSPMLDTPVRRAAALLEHIQRGDIADGAKTRDIWRRGWRLLRTANELSEALDVLEEHGWVRREEVKPEGGGRPSKVVRLNPELQE